MQTAVLDLMRWPKVPVRAQNCVDAATTTFRQLGMVEQSAPRDAGPAHGQTVWGSLCGNEPVGIAWDWTEVAPRVVVMSDPMCIVSNMQIVDNDGQPMAPEVGLLWLNAAIHGLAWQSAVVGSLEEAA